MLAFSFIEIGQQEAFPFKRIRHVFLLTQVASAQASFFWRLQRHGPTGPSSRAFVPKSMSPCRWNRRRHHFISDFWSSWLVRKNMVPNSRLTSQFRFRTQTVCSGDFEVLDILSLFSYHSVTASPQPGQRAIKKLKSAPWFRIVTEPVICVLPRFSAVDPVGQGTGEDFVLMYVESRDVKIQPLGSNTNTWCEARRPPELVKHGMASPFMTLFVFIADGFFNFPPKTDTAQKVHKKKLQWCKPRHTQRGPLTILLVEDWTAQRLNTWARLKFQGNPLKRLCFWTLLCMPSTTHLPPGPFYIPGHKFWPRTALAMLPLV